MRKPRSDAKLLNMPEAQQSQLAEWLLTGMPYHHALKLIKKEFKVASSLAALSDFYDAYCTAELINRRRRAVSTADEIAEEARKHPGQFDDATIDALKQQAFELAISPGANPKSVKQLFSLVLKARDQDLDEQQIALARDRFEFDAAKAALAQLPALRKIAGDKKLDQRAKLDAVRKRLFGQIPKDATADKRR